ETLQAFEMFESISRQHAGLPSEVALSVFFLCLLKHLGEEEQQEVPWLDIPKAIQSLGDEITQAMRARSLQGRFNGNAETPAGSADGPFILPAQLVPSDDLTHRALTAL